MKTVSDTAVRADVRGSSSPKTIRVLSVDGGGMRGIYSAAYLQALTQRYAKARGSGRLDFGKAFALIAGTSTGAIVACALAIGVPIERIMALYREQGPRIFPLKLPKGLLGALAQSWCRPKHLARGADALKLALEFVFEATTLEQVWKERGIALAVPAVEMSRHKSWVFKTPHLPNTYHRDDNYSLVDVCLASTAAPIFRSLARVSNPDTPGDHVFADGGLWANNPVLVGLIDALEMSAKGDNIDVFCLGTCPEPAGEQISQGDLDRGLLQWRFGADAATLALDAQHYAFDRMARFLSKHVERRCRVVRFPHGDVARDLMKHLDLDDTSDKAMDALVSQAQTDVDETLSLCSNPTDEIGQIIDSLFRELPLMEESDPVPAVNPSQSSP